MTRGSISSLLLIGDVNSKTAKKSEDALFFFAFVFLQAHSNERNKGIATKSRKRKWILSAVVRKTPIVCNCVSSTRFSRAGGSTRFSAQSKKAGCLFAHFPSLFLRGHGPTNRSCNGNVLYREKKSKPCTFVFPQCLLSLLYCSETQLGVSPSFSSFFSWNDEIDT